MELFFFETITNIFWSKLILQFSQIFKKFFVLTSLISFSKFSMIKILFFLLYNKVCKANLRSFLFNFNETVFGFGPKITPPPFHNGERLEPARARPVPFCCHGFAPPPRTSLRVFVEEVPCLCELECLKNLYELSNFLILQEH